MAADGVLSVSVRVYLHLGRAVPASNLSLLPGIFAVLKIRAELQVSGVRGSSASATNHSLHSLCRVSLRAEHDSPIGSHSNLESQPSRIHHVSAFFDEYHLFHQ